MNYHEMSEWLKSNGALDVYLQEYSHASIGTTGIWVGIGGVLFSSYCEDPVGDLYDQVHDYLWATIDDIQ